MAEYKNFSQETKQQAKNASLAEYFKTNCYTLKQLGSEIYVKEIPGLCINTKENSWYSHYEGFGGKSAIDCLTKVLYKDFQAAVEELTGVSAETFRQSNERYKSSFQGDKVKGNPANKELQMPERADNFRRIYAYLVKSRGIPQEIVHEMIHQKLLYQDKKGNAVFVHRDKDGKEIGAEVQGTCTNVRYKGVASGTKDSVFIFKNGDSDNLKRAYVFESAIDLCSFYALCDKKKLQDTMLISMAGLKPGALKEIEKSGVKILSCVDNDERGRKFESDNHFSKAGNLLEKENVKDWNELIQKKQNGKNPELAETKVQQIEEKAKGKNEDFSAKTRK